MDRDDDLARLFSWLQTSELRYREFAGERTISDAVVTFQTETNTAVPADRPAERPRSTQLAEEYPPDQYPDQAGVRVRIEPAVHTPETIAPTPMRPSTPPSPSEPAAPSQAGQQGGEGSLDAVFGRLGSGRDNLPDPRERPRNVPGLGRPR